MMKAAIFDLDGTLVNAYPAVAHSVNYTLNFLGLASRSSAEIKRSVGGGDRKLLAHFLPQKLVPRALAVYRRHHVQALHVKKAVRLLPGVRRVLEFLKGRGYSLAIASNRPTKFTRIILKELGVWSFFDVVLCADRVRRLKPYPHILWAIVRRLGLHRQEVLYVADMIIDIHCARRAGIPMVAVATGSSSKKELKDLKPWRIIDKMNQLEKIISRLKTDPGTKPGRGWHRV